jgi:hypothetical protein
MEGNAESPPLM